MGIAYNATDAAFGFRPYGNVLRQNLYSIITAPTINVYHHDLVVTGGVITTTPYGYMLSIEDGAVPDGNPGIIGSVMSVFDHNMDPVSYLAAAAVGNGTIAGYVMVADHQEQLYIAQEDGVTNAIDLAEGGLNADLISVALCAGDTTTGLSTQEIDSDTAAVTEALQLTIIQPHMDDTPANDTYPNARWLCRINEHMFGATRASI